MAEIKLAIVIPYFKIDYFEECLQSLALQSNQNFSIYIGNDCSPVDPLPTIKKFLKDERYRYYNYHENLGGISIASQWERILENVEEDWFQILGDDDALENNFVELFYAHYNSFKDLSIVKFMPKLYSSKGKMLLDSKKSYTTGIYSTVDFFIKRFQFDFHSSLSEHVFKKSAFSRVGFKKYPLAWHSDDMLILEISNYSSFYFITEASVHIRLFEGSTSGRKDNNVQKEKASKMFFDNVSKKFRKVHKTKVQLKKLKEIFLYNRNNLTLTEQIYWLGFPKFIIYYFYDRTIRKIVR